MLLRPWIVGTPPQIPTTKPSLMLVKLDRKLEADVAEIAVPEPGKYPKTTL